MSNDYMKPLTRLLATSHISVRMREADWVDLNDDEVMALCDAFDAHMEETLPAMIGDIRSVLEIEYRKLRPNAKRPARFFVRDQEDVLMSESEKETIDQAFAIAAKYVIDEIERIKNLQREGYIDCVPHGFMEWEFRTEPRYDHHIIARSPGARDAFGTIVAIPKLIKAPLPNNPGVQVGTVSWDVGREIVVPGVRYRKDGSGEPDDIEWEVVFADCPSHRAAMMILLMWTDDTIDAGFTDQMNNRMAADEVYEMTKTTCIIDRKIKLEEAQQLIGGGYVERIKIKGGVILADEDGIAKRLEYNPVASSLAGGPILGDVLVLMGKARHGW